MRSTALTTAAMILIGASAALAQEQQAGNEASTNAEATFQQLVEQCDNTEALTKRARVRLLIGRTTDEAAGEAETLLQEGLAACGEGNMDEALTKLDSAIEVADAGTEEVFSTDDGSDAADADPTEASADATATGESAEEAPWWQFWK